MKSPREVLEKFGIGYEGLPSQEKELDQALADLSEIVMGERRETGTGDDNNCWDRAFEHIAKLFTDKEQTK